jgi:hypothetical protein
MVDDHAMAGKVPGRMPVERIRQIATQDRLLSEANQLSDPDLAG